MEQLAGAEAIKDPLFRLANIMKHPVISLSAYIDDRSFIETRRVLDNIGEQKSLSLIVNSLGGSIECAFLIAKGLREKCSHLNVIVPDQAKSAATLIALAADRIFLGKFGELGPLDPQVPDLTSGSGRRSPLEIVKGMEFLRTYCVETFDLMMLYLLPRTGMDVAHTFDHVRELLYPIANPLYQSVNYRELGEASRHLEVSQNYARETMRRWSPLPEGDTEDIVDQLVWGYPDHGYIIDIDEAKRIGLSIAEPIPLRLEELCHRVIREQESPVIFAAPENDGQNANNAQDIVAEGGENEDYHETFND